MDAHPQIEIELNAEILANNAALREALKDMLSGWKYIRQVHGDLYGVGWDRAQKKAEDALANDQAERLPAKKL
jgi:hypothetical protein